MPGTDMTRTITVLEGRAYVFVAVDHANSEVAGMHAARSANRFEALDPIRQGVHRCFGSYRPNVARWIEARVTIMAKLHVRRLPGPNRLPGDRALALLSARTRGQWPRRGCGRPSGLDQNAMSAG